MRRSALTVAIGLGVVALAIVAITLLPSRRPPAGVAVPPSPSLARATPSAPDDAPRGSPTPAPSPDAGSSSPTLRFVNFGDWGNGPEPEREIFRQLERTHATLGFSDIVTNGDNNYGSAATFPAFVQAELGRLTAAEVKLHFSLGNHDIDADDKLAQQIGNLAWGEWDCRECQRARPATAGSRYYSFYRPPVRFVMLDSNLMLRGDTDQYLWAVQEVTASNVAGEPWQVLVFHHPLFSAAQTHGGIQQLVERYKPALKQLGVDVVFTGHDHTYERIKTTPECGDGVQHVVSGAIRLRKGDIKKPNACTAAYWDQSPAFVYAVATPEQFSAQVITSDGTVVDRWEIRQQP